MCGDPNRVLQLSLIAHQARAAASSSDLSAWTSVSSAKYM